jgi:BioD-like phosphotransacetylase family protein
MSEVTTIGLARDGKNYNDPCLVLQTPRRGGVGKTCGVIALLLLLTSSVVYKAWFKGISTKVSEERGSVTFSFNFP